MRSSRNGWEARLPATIGQASSCATMCSRRSPHQGRPRGFPNHDSAYRRVFCAPRDDPLRLSPQRLPLAHHRLQLPIHLPQHPVPWQVAVLLRTPAPHVRQQHHPTANARPTGWPRSCGGRNRSASVTSSITAISPAMSTHTSRVGPCPECPTNPAGPMRTPRAAVPFGQATCP